MIDNTTDALIYLDHNVLDKITKEQLDTIFKRLSPSKITPVYSDENLQEIAKAKGYENKLLSRLKAIGAVYLRLENVNSRYTGKAAFIDIDPFEAYSQYMGNKMGMPDLGYGLTDMLHKFYGGLSDKTSSEVLTLGISELLEELDNSAAELQYDENLSRAHRILAQEAVAQVRNVLPKMYEHMGKTLDGNTAKSTIIEQVDKSLAGGPKNLNNIKAPNVVRQIWELLKTRFPDKALTLDMFFGLTPDLYGPADKRELSLVEKVNALYHQLNFLGYHRDAKMQDRNRFNASFSDRTHAGCAVFCHYIMSMDKRLIMKTAAAYERLDVFTKTVHLKLSRNVQGTKGRQ